MAKDIVIRLLEYFLHRQASLVPGLEDCRAGSRAEGRAEGALAGIMGEGALAAGRSSLGGASVGVGSFAEDEEFDEEEED